MSSTMWDSFISGGEAPAMQQTEAAAPLRESSGLNIYAREWGGASAVEQNAGANAGAGSAFSGSGGGGGAGAGAGGGGGADVAKYCEKCGIWMMEEGTICANCQHRTEKAQQRRAAAAAAARAPLLLLEAEAGSGARRSTSQTLRWRRRTSTRR
eukprot:Rhum_TRINITY_DN14288_c20_g1::Rhum_TRINITY_DN14288_c20_g1_i1::g.74092::m.74092